MLFCEKVVAKILPFRKENKKFLDPIWNKHHIERVEVILKESLDVKGNYTLALIGGRLEVSVHLVTFALKMRKVMF